MDNYNKYGNDILETEFKTFDNYFLMLNISFYILNVVSLNAPKRYNI